MSEVRVRAEADFAAGRFTAVLDAARTPVADGRSDPELLHLAAKAAIRLSRPVDAVGLLQTAVMLAPANNALWFELGDAWYALRQFHAADQAWGNVAALSTLSPAAPRRRKAARIMAGVDNLNWAGIRRDVRSPGMHFWSPNVEAAIPDPAERVPMLVWLGAERRGEVCISIDDGPSPDYTPALLSILKAKKAHAAFFLVGASVERHPELVQQIADDGHEIYTHSYSHSVFTDLDEDAIISELSRAEELLSRFRSTPSPYPVRLPGGMGWDMPHIHRAIRRWNPDAVLAHWTVDPRDWAGQATIAMLGDPVREAKIRLVEMAIDPAMGGAIVLAHDCRIGLPRTHPDFFRTFFEGLADIISDAHLTTGRLLPPRSAPPENAPPEPKEEPPHIVATPEPPAPAPQSSSEGQNMIEVVRVDHTNWRGFTSAYEVNGAPIAAWRRTLAQPWVDPSKPIAYVLVDGRKCVGWLQTIYADTRFGDGEPPTLICSLSGWYVHEDYRFNSLKLILGAMNDADTTPMTVFTASHTAARIYTGLRWHLLDKDRWTIPLSDRAGGPILVDDVEAIFDRLSPGEQRVVNDHRAHNLNHAMITAGDRYCYYSYLVHERLNQQVADILYLAGESDLLLEQWQPKPATPLASCAILNVDSRYFGDRPVNLPRGDMWGARMFHGPIELRSKLSMLYSEVPIYHPFLL